MKKSHIIKSVAQAGLTAKGVVYILLGLLAFMAAFELRSQSGNEATQTGALKFVKDLPAGLFLLIVVALGIFCYSIWRFIQAFRSDGKDKKWTKRLWYFISGLTYLAFAATAFRLVLGQSSGQSDQNQDIVRKLLNQPFGQVLVGLAGLILAAVGAYQIYYGLSEKYRKHVQDLSLASKQSTLMLRSGKIGYVSRGAVWLVISFLFFRAALHASSSQAGNTAKAFRFVESTPFGSYLLGLLGLGLIAYGIFCFVRARFEQFV